MAEAICRMARCVCFDEQFYKEIFSEDFDFRATSELFASVLRKLAPSIGKTLGLVVSQRLKDSFTKVAVLLFGKQCQRFVLAAAIRCASVSIRKRK